MWYLIILALSAGSNCWAMDENGEKVRALEVDTRQLNAGNQHLTTAKYGERILLIKNQDGALYTYTGAPKLFEVEFPHRKHRSVFFVDDNETSDLRFHSLKQKQMYSNINDDHPYNNVIEVCGVDEMANRLMMWNVQRIGTGNLYATVTTIGPKMPDNVTLIKEISKSLLAVYSQEGDRTYLAGFLKNNKRAFKKIKNKYTQYILDMMIKQLEEGSEASVKAILRVSFQSKL